MTGPKISVILPVYNGLPYIQKSLKSALDQEYPAHEVIVINDGSKDDTQKILDSYKGRIVTRTIPNEGVSNARNEGIRLATGDYLAFLDSDDLWFRNKLKVTADFIQRYPDVGYFGSDYILRIPEFNNRLLVHSKLINRREEILFNEPYKKHPLNLLLAHRIGLPPSVVTVKKNIAEAAGLFNPQCRLVEDLDFYLRVAMKTRFLLIDKILLYKRNHPENMSNNTLRMYVGRRKVVESFFAAQKDAIQTLGLAGVVQDDLANDSYTVGNLHYEFRDQKKAFAAYRDALKFSSSPKNLGRYLWTIFKKSARLLTNDKISRKNSGKGVS